MSTETTAPSLEEFLAVARAEFSYVADYGFSEVLRPQDGCVTAYAILFERGDWRLEVEGLGYGFSADVVIVSPDGRQAGFGHLVPEAFRSAHREGLGLGQLGEVRFSALCLKTLGESFLNGDLSLFDELWVLAQKAIESDRDYWKNRHMECAINEAAAAFRNNRFADVVSLLSPHESLLPPAQAAKLELARRRCH